MFVVGAVVILAAVAVLLTYPLWRKSQEIMAMGHEADQDQERVELEIEKQTLLSSLAELDQDLAQGRLLEDDHRRLKAINEHQLVEVLNKQDAFSRKSPGRSRPKSERLSIRSVDMRWTVSFVLGLLVIGAASGLYTYVNGIIGLEAQKTAMEQQGQAVAGGQGMPNPLEMVARLEKRLAENPNDLQGQIMAGRSYMTLQRIGEAKKAWAKVIELEPGNHEAHYYLGLILLNTTQPGDPRIYQEALSHFDIALVKVPREPAVLWYRGVALVHLGRYSEADESWTNAFQNLPPGSEDAEFVKKQLQSLRAGNLPQF
jgi:cytochrome c-type biogenesis protein CcmH